MFQNDAQVGTKLADGNYAVNPGGWYLLTPSQLAGFASMTARPIWLDIFSYISVFAVLYWVCIDKDMTYFAVILMSANAFFQFRASANIRETFKRAFPDAPVIRISSNARQSVLAVACCAPRALAAALAPLLATWLIREMLPWNNAVQGRWFLDVLIGITVSLWVLAMLGRWGIRRSCRGLRHDLAQAEPGAQYVVLPRTAGG